MGNQFIFEAFCTLGLLFLFHKKLNSTPKTTKIKCFAEKWKIYIASS